MQPSDLELVRAAAEGDGDAFSGLVDRHATGLFRAAMSLTATRADAEDLLQETLLGAYRGLRRFDGRASVKTWLNSILIRQAAKGWQRGRKHRQTKGLHLPDQSEPIDDRSLQIKSASEQSDQRIDLLAMVKTLAPEHREVVVLREVEGLSYEEMAQTLGVPRGTIDSRLYRARQELKAKLADYRESGQ